MKKKRGWTVRSVARRLWVRRAIILAYHRVARLECDPECLSVEPDNFLEQLEVLRRHYRVIPLTELHRRLDDATVPRKAVVVTFDDGYADNLLSARPLLDYWEAPATCFVTSGKLDQKTEFWWDELAFILLEQSASPEVLSLEIEGRYYSWCLREHETLATACSTAPDLSWNVLHDAPPTPRQKAYLELAAILRTTDANAQDAAMRQLAAWAGVERRVRETHRPLRPEEVVRLNDGGLVEIGAHTVTHPVLAAHAPEAQRREIETAKQQLENLVGGRVSAFAYPFGTPADYTGDTVNLVRNAGFKCACSNFPGWVRRGTSVHELPRYLVRNWNGDEFARNLGSWYAN
jgi:peptidoglycan/xylan/chitin deacetylase (PgdA/CDA1 family)